MTSAFPASMLITKSKHAMRRLYRCPQGIRLQYGRGWEFRFGGRRRTPWSHPRDAHLELFIGTAALRFRASIGKW